MTGAPGGRALPTEKSRPPATALSRFSLTLIDPLPDAQELFLSKALAFVRQITHINLMRPIILSLGILLFVLLTAGRAAVLLGTVGMNGFVSQGTIVSDHNQYLGTTNTGEYRFSELGLNFVYCPITNLRLGVQMFAFQLGKYGNMVPMLDWATVDYQPYSWFGIRAGRVKVPIGLHNDTIDLDVVRSQIFLPQGMYDPRGRDLFNAIDGGSFYGTVPLGKYGGNFDYNLFIGTTKPDADSGTGDFFSDRNPIIFNNFQVGEVYGFHLNYNTPVRGLRAGSSLVYISDLSFSGTYKTTEEFSRTPNRFSSLGDSPFLAGAQRDLGGRTARMDSNGFTIWTAFAEYTVEDWTFTAEFSQRTAEFIYTTPGSPAVGNLNGTARGIHQQSWYGSVSKRITKWLELGSYYSMWWNDYNDMDGTDQGNRSGAGLSNLDGGTFQQEDIAFSARFDVTSNWIIKAEVHKYNGTGLLFNVDGQNPLNTRSQDWMMFAVKTSYSF
jgi:hypothetical protein